MSSNDQRGIRQTSALALAVLALALLAQGLVVRLVTVGWVVMFGPMVTTALAGALTLVWWGNPRATLPSWAAAAPAAAPVVARVSAATLSASLVGFAVFVAVLNNQGWEALLKAYRALGGGLLEDLWGPLVWMQIVGSTAAWTLLAVGAFTLPLAVGVSVYMMFNAVDLVVNTTGWGG